MNATIDIGNTLIKIGIFDEDNLSEVFQFEQEQEALELLESMKLKHVIVSSVKSNAIDFLSKIPNQIKKLLLTHSTPLPISNSYQSPETLGMDRVSSIMGAYSLYPNTNCLVIDMGTCIKCDVLDKSNNYQGGSISPGIKMRFKALKEYTSKLPLVEFEDIVFLTGKSTKESILSGVINGAVFEIEGFINQYSQKFSQLNVIITGGDAYCFESRIKPHIFVVPNLVLLGLNKILLYNLSITSA